jgi:beta-glucanase (GH16 family)
MVILSGILAACVTVESVDTVEQTPIATNMPMETRMIIEQTPTEEGTPNPWKLVWREDFNDNRLDKGNWTADVNDWGGGNQELQYYTGRRQNVYVENGLLNIVGRKERYLTREYTSARLTSVWSWTYGRFEVRAKLPAGRGIWSAIWLRAAGEPYGPWAASGEIDIMELLGHEPNVIYGTLHYGLPWPGNEQKQASAVLQPEEFHVFALEWDVNEIRWYVDDVNYLTVNTWYTSGGDYPAPFDQPFNIVLNLAIGGTWPGNPDASTTFPQKLLIDYVKVYQK